MADKVTIEKCRRCEHDTINPITIHKVWSNGIGNDLFNMVCNHCQDFIPAKIGSYELDPAGKAIAIWNQYQLELQKIKDAIENAKEKEEEADGQE
jgi:hypothetical protein